MKIHNILGLDSNASHSTIEDAYQAKRQFFSADRFKEGDVGFQAAKKIDELDAAYRDYVDSLIVNDTTEEPTLEKVDALVKANRLDEAQTMIDKIYIKNGDWHYTQALIFYKREWFSECRKNLEIAINLDPQNPKYRDTLSKLDMQVNNSAYSQQGFNNTYNQAYGRNQYQQRNTFVDCCCAYCMMELCCACMR